MHLQCPIFHEIIYIKLLSNLFDISKMQKKKTNAKKREESNFTAKLTLFVESATN